MNNKEVLEQLFTLIPEDLAKIDYIVGAVQQKILENSENEQKQEVLAELLQEIELILTPTVNMELH